MKWRLTTWITCSIDNEWSGSCSQSALRPETVECGRKVGSDFRVISLHPSAFSTPNGEHALALSHVLTHHCLAVTCHFPCLLFHFFMSRITFHPAPRDLCRRLLLPNPPEPVAATPSAFHLRAREPHTARSCPSTG